MKIFKINSIRVTKADYLLLLKKHTREMLDFKMATGVAVNDELVNQFAKKLSA